MSFFLYKIYSHSFLCHPILKDAASFREGLVQALALGSGLAGGVLLAPVASSTRGVEAECVLQGEIDKQIQLTLCSSYKQFKGPVSE